MPTTPSSIWRRPGRPLDRTRDHAILLATLECLADLGYDALTIDEVAARAHASKTTIYRRWPSKARLAVDAVLAWRESLAPIAIPDTGSLGGDLEAMVAAIPEFSQMARRQLAVTSGLLSAAGRHAELRGALTTLLAQPRSLVRDVLSRAVQRGEVRSDCDVDLIVDGLLGLTILRALLGDVPDRGFALRAVHNFIRPHLQRPPPGGTSTASSSAPKRSP